MIMDEGGRIIVGIHTSSNYLVIIYIIVMEEGTAGQEGRQCTVTISITQPLRYTDMSLLVPPSRLLVTDTRGYE